MSASHWSRRAMYCCLKAVFSSSLPSFLIFLSLFTLLLCQLPFSASVSDHPALAGNLAITIQKKLGIPVVYTYHTRYEQYLHYIKPLEFLNDQTNVVTAYTKYFCNQCNLLFAPTPGMKDYLESLEVKTPIEVLPNKGVEEASTVNISFIAAIRIP